MVIVEPKAKNIKGIPFRQAQDADLIVGKGNVVLKDRYGIEGEHMTDAQLIETCASAKEVVGTPPVMESRARGRR